MSVEGVSLTLLTGLNSIYQSICLHLTPENREAILGSALAKMSGRGTGKTAVASALYSDALRIVLSAIDADGKISSDEIVECEKFLVAVASTFAKIRGEYGAFANLSKTETRIFLQHYKDDKGVFGYRDESTKWAGLSICRNVEQHCSDGVPLETFRTFLLSAARTLIAADGVSVGEQGFLSKLSKQLKSQSASDSGDDELIMEFLGSSSTGKPNHSHSVKPPVKTNQEWADAMFPGTEEPSAKSQPKMALYSDSTIRTSTSSSKTRVTQPERPKPKISGPVCCPRCGSSDIFGTTRGFNHLNAAIGLLGNSPAAALFMGSRDSADVINNCKQCGNSWAPRPKTVENPDGPEEFVAGVWAVVAFMMGFWLCGTAINRSVSPGRSLIDSEPWILLLSTCVGMAVCIPAWLISRRSLFIQIATYFLLFGSMFVGVFWFALYYFRFTGQYGKIDFSHVSEGWSIGSAVVGVLLWIAIFLKWANPKSRGF